MKKQRIFVALAGAFSLASAYSLSAQIVFEPKEGPGKGKNVVLLAGDDEYFSEEGIPLLARILAERHGFRSTVCFSTNPETGVIKAIVALT